MERRLSAIFAADMVGYSRLMEADEVGTLERQKAHRQELINPTLKEYHGRIVKEMGDGILVEFPSVVEAVQCAVIIQQGMVDREAEVTSDLRIQYRIGINLGDIIIEDDDIFGDGVNVAARLEQLAEPGGVCISGTTYDQLKSKVEVGYESLGEVQVKNIKQAVRAYKILTDPVHAGETIGEKRIKFAVTYKFAVTAAVFLFFIIGGGTWWWSQQPDIDPADPMKLAQNISDKPSIAVLPFDNISNDPEQDFFSDGITEDLITDLSQISGLFVIARNTVFTFKGKAQDIQRIGNKLGVKYILEGSVRKSGSNIRVNAQLINVKTGGHI
jgi:adenylate cyclase